MIGLSAEAEDREGGSTSDPPALRLPQATARAREPAAEIADALRHLTPCPTWSEPDVVNAPLVNDIKRRGVRMP